MAWEQRRDKRYYYKSVRCGKKVLKVYFGSGPAAEVAAQTTELARQQRQARAEAVRARREQYQYAEALVNQLIDHADGETRAELMLAGIHENQGVWRRRTPRKNKEVT